MINSDKHTIYIISDRATQGVGQRISERLRQSRACADGILRIVCCHQPVELLRGGTVMLLGGEQAAALCPDTLPIAVSSSNRAALRMLGRRGHHAIICGMYTRDTLSLSSYEYDRAMVALQRTVLSADGSELEPREIKIYLKQSLPSSDIPLIAAAMLLNGCCPENEFEI